MVVDDKVFRSPILVEGGDPNVFDVDWRYQIVKHVVGRLCQELPNYTDCRDDKPSTAAAAKKTKTKPKPRSKPKAKADPSNPAQVFVDAFSHIVAEYPTLLRDDPHFYGFVTLAYDGHHSLPPARMMQRHRFYYTLSRWNDDPVYSKQMGWMKALLLSPAGIDEVAVQTQLNRDLLRLYCAYFFDVRSDTGVSTRPGIMAQIIATGGECVLSPAAPTPQRWLMQAANPLGYVMLSHQFGITPASTLSTSKIAELQGNAARARLTQRIADGTLSAEFLLGVVNSAQAQERFDREVGRDSTGDGGWAVSAALLGAHKPRLIEAAPSVESVAAENAAIRSRWESQSRIGSTVIKDRGVSTADILESAGGQSPKVRPKT